ncbi:MAG: hypothetical protein WD577_12915 [Bacteroidales bacterium]
MIRIDRSRLAFEYELTLGHFGLPHIDGVEPEVRKIEKGGIAGMTATIPGRRVALIAYHGWDNIEVRSHVDRNAEASESTVLYVQKKRLQKNLPMELIIAIFVIDCHR